MIVKRDGLFETFLFTKKDIMTELDDEKAGRCWIFVIRY